MTRHTQLATARIRSTMIGLPALALLALSGCASFHDVPTYTEVFEEQLRCSQSRLCRTFIENRPPQLKLALNDAPIGAAHAAVSECILREQGIPTRTLVVRMTDPTTREPVLHTFLGAQVRGSWYAVDNGILPFCGKVCTMAEALHNTVVVSDGMPAQLAAGH